MTFLVSMARRHQRWIRHLFRLDMPCPTTYARTRNDEYTPELMSTPMKFTTSALFATLAFTIAGCGNPHAPYEKTGRSQPVEDIFNPALTLDNGQTYRTRGYIELFQPNYFVLVKATDGRDLSDDFDGASSAARAAIEGFDCANGTEIKPGSSYAASQQQWLIVVDCQSGGRSLTGS